MLREVLFPRMLLRHVPGNVIGGSGESSLAAPHVELIGRPTLSLVVAAIIRRAPLRHSPVHRGQPRHPLARVAHVAGAHFRLFRAFGPPPAPRVASGRQPERAASRALAFG